MSSTQPIVIATGSGGAGGDATAVLMLFLILLCAAGTYLYFVYEKPCRLKKHTPTLYEWTFRRKTDGTRKIGWPKDPTECPS